MANGAEILLVTQETIIYRLMMENHDSKVFLKKHSIFGRKMGLAATLVPKGLVPQDPTKKLAFRVELLGQPLSHKNVFENLGPEPPLKSS